MKKAFGILNGIFHPPKRVMFPLSALSFASLVFIFATEKNNGALAYTVYGMSAYCLTVLILPLPKSVRKIKNSIIRSISATETGDRYINDIAFRGNVNLCQGIIVNFLYVVFRIAVGIRYTSVWFISVAAYYLALGVIRLSLVLGRRSKKTKEEVLCYRRTAWLLFLLNIPMGGMILLMVLADYGYSYPGYVIYLSAVYTFYTAICAIVNLVKFHKLGSPILSAAKALNFISAIMSLLALQTAMIAQFAEKSDGFRKMMNAATGSVVWLSVILTAVYMLCRSRKIEDEVKSVEQIRK